MYCASMRMGFKYCDGRVRNISSDAAWCYVAFKRFDKM